MKQKETVATENRLVVAKGERGGSGMDDDFSVNVYKYI